MQKIFTLNWNDIKSLMCSPPINTLPRNEEIDIAYKKHQKCLKDNNISIENHIMSKYFKDNTIKEYFTLNAYPYYLENNIYHYVIWLNPNYYKNNEDNSFNNIVYKPFIKMIISKKYPKNEFIYYENEIKNRSVMGIRHIHVFIKNDT